MVSNRWFVVVAALGALLIGVVAYNAGLSHGAAQAAIAAGSAATPGTPGVPVPPYAYAWGWHRPWGFGFPFFFVIFFWFILLKGLFSGGPWRRRYYYGGPDRMVDGFDEWHRRAHERMRDDHAPSTPTA